MTLIVVALTECPIKYSDVLENCELLQTNYEASPSTFHIESSDHENKIHNDKSVQVNIKPKYRSKGNNVNFTIKKENLALSPLPILCKNAKISPVKSGLTSGFKNTLFADNAADVISTSSHYSVLPQIMNYVVVHWS